MDIGSIISWISSLVSDHIYWGVFVAALLETVFPPIPSEIVFPLAGVVASKNDLSIFHVILIGISGGAGATVGAVGIYFAALKVGRIAFVRLLAKMRIKEKKLQKAENWFARYGDKSVMFGRLVPGLRELVSVPAGLLRMNPVKFLTYTFLGSCGWAILLTVIGYYFGVGIEGLGTIQN